MQLIVAEKPSVARDIARVLGAKNRAEGYMEGNGYRVTWAFGHLVAPCEPQEIDPKWKRWHAADLPILPDTIPLKVLPKTKAQFNIIKKLMRDSATESIICATDAGREGELIFRRIVAMVKPHASLSMSRLWISSMTDEAIKQGFSALRPLSEYDGLYKSALCRADADWLVGMNGSRAFTLRYGVLLSVGRVQTPTLAILVKRFHEIEAFVPEKYFEVEANFGDYKGLWMNADGKTRLEEQAKAKAIAAKVKGKDAIVSKGERTRKRVPPPQLYDLTSLQRDANRRTGMTADQTLKTAQALYEKHKVITYPRTDSNCLPRDMIATAGQVLRSFSGEYRRIAALTGQNIPTPARVFNDKKVSDHHAIIPTKKKPGQMTDAEEKVYDLIVRRFIGAFMQDYEYDALRVETTCEGETFLSLGQCPVAAGWKAAWKDGDEENGQNLPDLNPGDIRNIQAAKVLNRTTKPPPPHTEASLLQAMERAGREVEDEEARELMKDSGLGTPATRAAIIERLLQVGYAYRKGRAVHATEKGVRLIAIVPAELSSPETTGRWEKGLSRIRTGEMDPVRFMGSIKRFAMFLTERAAKAQGASPFPPEVRGVKKKRKIK